MSSFSTRRLISFQKDPLPLSFLLFLRKSFFESNTPPLSGERIFRQESGRGRKSNERKRRERERFLCPRFNLPDKESPGIYPRLKNPLDMNRATVDVQRDDASFFLDRFLFCHLFPSLPLFIPFLPIQGFLFSTGLIKPFDSTVHRFARSRSFGSTFRAQSKITTREGLVLPFLRGSNRIFEYILPIIRSANFLQDGLKRSFIYSN